MEDKLKQLTKKIVEEGIEAAEQERTAMISDAKEKASKIIDEAEKKSKLILDNAQKEAAAIRERTESELSMVTRNIIVALKKDIRSLLQRKVVNEPVANTLKDKQYLVELIKSTLQQATDKKDKLVLLPESRLNEVKETIASDLDKVLSEKIELQSSSGLFNGFAISCEGEDFFVSYSEADFARLLHECFNEEMNQLFNHGA